MSPAFFKRLTINDLGLKLVLFFTLFIIPYSLFINPVYAQTTSGDTFCSDNKTVSVITQDPTEPSKTITQTAKTCGTNSQCQTISDTQADCVSEGTSCQYPQSNPDSGKTEVCNGVYQIDSASNNMVCGYDSSGNVTPNCVPESVTSACTGDPTYFTDAGGNCIQKSGGYYDKNNPNADPTTGCVYNFAKATSNASCQNPSQNPTSSNTTNVISGVDSNGQAVPANSTNWDASKQTNYSVENLEHSALCELAGMSPLGQCVGQTLNPQTGKPQTFLFNQTPGGGALGSLTGVMTAMYTNPPTSTTQYLAGIGQNLGLVKPVYAAGVGGSGAGIITPVLTLWQVTRNLSYLAFIIVFVVVGFMIMFRARINPQTVISAQSALPGLIIGLILVTFSYFIAALLVDFAFVGMQLVAQLFISSGAANAFGDATNIHNIAQNSSAFQLFSTSGLRWENVKAVMDAAGTTIFNNGIASGTYAISAVITGIIGGVIGSFFGPLGILIGAGVGAAAGPAAAVPILGLLVPLILIIALFIQFFRLLFQLITAYIAILVSTVTGPFIILISSIPGRSGGLAFWWKTLLGNALVFPAVFAAFLFAGLILGTTDTSWKTAPPLFGGISPFILRLIIAYGIILGIPAVPGMVKKAMGVPEIQGIPQEATAGALAGFGVARGAATRGWQAGTSALQRQRQAYQEAYARYQVGVTEQPPINPLTGVRMGAPAGTPPEREAMRLPRWIPRWLAERYIRPR